MNYHFSKMLDVSFDEAIIMVTEELKKQGFGILMEIDVKETLKKKLDVEFRSYKILGACNPPFAYQALELEDKIGLMLPCNVIVPVPLHSRRLKQRGYNQSCLLADKLGKIISLPVVKDSLLRCRDNVPQAKTATVEERLRNVEGVFVCKDSVLTGKQVMLVDDVCTSAATMEACAATLKDAGAA